ncbi:hypothetical protein PsAD2_03133 [Pseudovibrio axinellae]|uniref:Uncharacterized protein n=1 Tax=Pseudovibrio axinellae TaxID=989403 RepID=A0A165X7Q4_9HYPH|nr:hypothetical protein [Pseudovibrio axinellae]KZL17432.1 hypothetical protein PsAD2_03133 [Pseudovibrio axinellae]SER80343.1 hypothetical protein SAMN05421798_1258 [Pseudovibrio axinellae]
MPPVFAVCGGAVQVLIFAQRMNAGWSTSTPHGRATTQVGASGKVDGAFVCLYAIS